MNGYRKNDSDVEQGAFNNGQAHEQQLSKTQQSKSAIEYRPPKPSESSSAADDEKAEKEPPKGAKQLLWHHTLHQLQGHKDEARPRPHWWGMIYMPLCAFISIMYISGLNRYTLPHIGMHLLLPPLGATAVLLFAAPETPLSQPRNVIGGHILSAIVGCTVRNIFPQRLTWVAAPFAVAASIFLTMLTRTLHPPAGATALFISTLQPQGKWASWIYVPAFAIGTIGMQLIALVLNLLSPSRPYPTFWWGSDSFRGGL